MQNGSEFQNQNSRRQSVEIKIIVLITLSNKQYLLYKFVCHVLCLLLTRCVLTLYLLETEIMYKMLRMHNNFTYPINMT